MTSEDDHKAATEPPIEAIIKIAEQLAGNDIHDGYIHIGPASSGAFRFKWTARQKNDGRFVVEETIGSGSVAVSSPPMRRDEVLAYIEARQRRIQAKVDEVKRELAGIQGEIDGVPPVAAPRDPLQMFDEIRRMLKEGK